MEACNQVYNVSSMFTIQSKASVTTWLDNKKARDLVLDTSKKTLEKCPLSIISLRVQDIMSSSVIPSLSLNFEEMTGTNVILPAPFFQSSLISKKKELLSLIKKKCESQGIPITEQEISTYI